MFISNELKEYQVIRLSGCEVVVACVKRHITLRSVLCSLCGQRYIHVRHESFSRLFLSLIGAPPFTFQKQAHNKQQRATGAPQSAREHSIVLCKVVSNYYQALIYHHIDGHLNYRLNCFINFVSRRSFDLRFGGIPSTHVITSRPFPPNRR